MFSHFIILNTVTTDTGIVSLIGFNYKQLQVVIHWCALDNENSIPTYHYIRNCCKAVISTF